MAIDGRLNFDTKIDTKGFTKSVGTLGNQLGSLKSLVLKLGSAIGLAFSAKELIEASASVNATNSQVAQTFGDLQTQAESAMQSVADTSGILETRLQGVGTSIYSFAKTAGMDSTTALNMMQEALQVTADQAAYYDRSLEDTSESLMSFLKGNYANDAALGISCTETTRNAAANKLYGKSFSDLSEAQKQLTLLQMVKDANALSGAEGQAAREADGWENVTGNLKEAWTQLLAVVGQPVLSVAVNVVKSMTEGLQNLTAVAKSAVSALSEVFGIELTNVSSSASSAADSYSDMAESAEEAAESTENSLASFDKINKLSDSSDSSSDSSASSAVSGLSGTISADVDVDTSSANKKMTDFFKWVKSTLKTIFTPFKSAWSKDGDGVVSSAKKAFNSLKDTVSEVGKTYGKVWSNGTGEKYISGILALWKDLLDMIDSVSTAFKNAWTSDGTGEKYVQSIFDMWNNINGLLHDVNGSFIDVWSNGTGEEIISDILGIWTDIYTTIGNIADRLDTAWTTDNLGTNIVQDAADLWDTILDHVNNITGKISDWSAQVDFQPLLTSFDDLEKSLQPFADKVGEGLETFVDEVLLPIADWTIEEAVPTFLDTLSAAIDGISAAWDTAYPVVKEKLWDQFLQPIASWAADTAVSLVKDLGDNIKKIGTSITEKQVAVLIDLAGAVGAIVLACKSKKVIDSMASSLSGLPGKLSGTWDTLTSDVGSAGISAGTALSAGIGAAFVGWQIGTFIRDLGVGEWVDGIVEDIGDAFNNLGWGEFFATIWETISGALKTVWDALSTEVMTYVVEPLKESFQNALNGIEEIFSGIGEWFSERWNDITGVFSDIGGWFNEKFTGAYSKITGAFSKTKSWASDRWSDISGAFSDVGGWFSEKFTGAYTNIKSAFSDPKGWAQTQWDNISGIFNDVGGWFSDKFTGAYTNIQSAFADPKGWAQTQWSNIKSGFANIKGWFSEKFGGAWDKIKEVFAFDTVKSHFISVKNSAVNGLVGVAGRIKQKFSDAWTKVKEAFSISTVKQHFKDIKDDIVEVFDGLSGALKTPFNAVIDLLNKGIRELNKFSIDVPDAISDVIGIDSFGFNIPEIPKLAQGTVIPPNKEFLAVLGDQKSGTNIEAPLSTIEQAVANVLSRWNGGNSGDMTIDMTVNLDGQKVYKDIIKLNKAQIRKTGNNPLAT